MQVDDGISEHQYAALTPLMLLLILIFWRDCAITLFTCPVSLTISVHICLTDALNFQPVRFYSNQVTYSNAKTSSLLFFFFLRCALCSSCGWQTVSTGHVPALSGDATSPSPHLFPPQPVQSQWSLLANRACSILGKPVFLIMWFCLNGLLS